MPAALLPRAERALAIEARAAKQLEADFETDNPPFDLAIAFALDHADKKRRGEEVNFHWASLAWDLRQRYGPAIGYQLYLAGLTGYPEPGRPYAHIEAWEATGWRLCDWNPANEESGCNWRYSDESFVSRLRGFSERPLASAQRWFKEYAAHAAQHPEWSRNDTIRAMEADVDRRPPYEAMLGYCR